MSGRGAKLEVEIKLKLDSAAQGRRLLRRAGFRLLRRRIHEYNLVFDTPYGSLRARGVLLRLRRAGRLATLTFKGPAAKGKYKSRQELETAVHDCMALEGILNSLGFGVLFRYEKYRTEFKGAGPGIACLDETPIGVYLELEGAPVWIRRAARSLGFQESSYITDTYGSLYRLHCQSKGIAPRDMLFPLGASLKRTSRPPGRSGARKKTLSTYRTHQSY
jgi:adenylate cyclase, class 2